MVCEERLVERVADVNINPVQTSRGVARLALGNGYPIGHRRTPIALFSGLGTIFQHL